MAVSQLPQTDVVDLSSSRGQASFGSRRFVDLANMLSWRDGLVAIFEGAMKTDRLTADVSEP
jgi:hypothetical protein